MILAHKIRLSPTAQQREYFACACGVSRFCWNWALEHWEAEHLAGGKPSGFALAREFNAVYREQYPWVAEVARECHGRPFLTLQAAFQSFFKSKTKRPRFHKKGRKDSFYVGNEGVQFEGNRVRLPRIGWVKMEESLRLTGKVMAASVSRLADWWFLSVQVEVGDLKKQRRLDGVIGVDVGLTAFATLSTGEKIEAPKPLARSLRRLQMHSRRLSRKVKGSKNREKQARRVARIHYHTAEIRNDFIQKLTTRLCRENQTVAVERLHVAGMVRNRCLARAISDAGWAEFKRQLEYKAVLYGTHLVIADPFYPSSKTCSVCGCIRESLALSERVFHCESCGAVLDRDHNAALNLRTLGQRGSNACGEQLL